MKIADPVRPYLYLALAAVIVLGLWSAGNAIYKAGVAAERAVWLEAQSGATEDADAQRRAKQAASDATTDETRSAAEADTQAARDQTTTTIERIRYVYRDQPASECPAVLVPDGVQDELRAAYDAARAAAR